MERIAMVPYQRTQQYLGPTYLGLYRSMYF